MNYQFIMIEYYKQTNNKFINLKIYKFIKDLPPRLIFEIFLFFLSLYIIKMVGCNKNSDCDCGRPVLCNSSTLKCWKTEVRVVSCGVSATDFPYDDDGFNQSSTLILSAHPNCVGNENKGCIALTDNCCESVQVIGDWASLHIPQELVVSLSLTLNNGEMYNFGSTTGINSIKPCTGACVESESPIFVAPAAAQPSPCLLLTLGQVVDYCNKTICWTLNVDVTNDCIGATTIGSIVNVGCTDIYQPDNINNDTALVAATCNNDFWEHYRSYDFNKGDNDHTFSQNFVNAYGNHSLILTKGLVVDGVDNHIVNSDTSLEKCIGRNVKYVISDVGLYQCQVYNFWAAAYANPDCLKDNHHKDGGQSIDPQLSTVIKFSPSLQKRILNFRLLWQVKRANGASKSDRGSNLRFELTRGNEDGRLIPVTTAQLYNYLRLWNVNIKARSLDPNTPEVEDPCTYTLTDYEGSKEYSSVFFIGIGDKCNPYNVFDTPSSGNQSQSVVVPYKEASLVTSVKSAWFGLSFACPSIDSSCGVPFVNPAPSQANSNCIC